MAMMIQSRTGSNSNPSAPIIVMGMHRSGTTLLTKILESGGVFWGALPDEYNESAFFQSLNEALFSMARSTWDAPESLKCFFKESEHRKRSAAFLGKRLREGFHSEYVRGYEPTSAIAPAFLPALWGWKDPRNVYTLGLWLEHFPDARVIHILRNGIDVALSLWQRERSRPEGKAHPHYSDRCQELNGCFSLWSIYVKAARDWVDSEESVLEVLYEELVTTPLSVLESIAGHIGLSLNESVVKAVDGIRPNTPTTHSSAPHIQAFIDRARKDALMMALGYDF